MRKNFIACLLIFSLIGFLQSQIIFQEKFNSLTLSTYTTLYTSTLYTTVPSGFMELCEGFPNSIGSSLHPNAPFHTDSLRYKGWGVVYNNTIKDTFLVSTSFVDSNRAISRWVILPVVSGISYNSVLHWKAMSPDPNFADGYAVYISTNTTINDTAIFSNSNKVFQINDNSTSGGGEKSQWTTRSISLSNYSGQSIRIAFKNISRQKYQLWIDDITIENLPYALDASLENTGNSKYVAVNQPFVLNARIKNNGYQNISNVNIAYSIQSISYNNQSFSFSSNLLPLNTSTVAFTNTLAINTAGMYKVKIWVNQVNGQTDQNHFNDTVSYYLSVLSNSTTPKILIEQLTDASMPDAPANQDTMKILANDTNLIFVQIHQYDSLQCNISGKHSQLFSVPENQAAAMINRNYFITDNKNYCFRNDLRKYINTSKTFVTPCKISISNMNVNTTTRNIQFDVNVQFFQNTFGDYRIGVYLMENNVHGNPADTTVNGYNQLSSFYFTPYSNYYQQGYFSNTANAFVLNAYQYKHQYVLNNAITGIYGDASVIPNNPAFSTNYSATYSLTVPTATNNVFRYNFDNLYVVAFVYEHDTLLENRKILNATVQKVTSNSELVSVSTYNTEKDILIYPNPAKDFIFFHVNNRQNIKSEIVNVFGQKVMDIHSEITDISTLSEGIYFVRVYLNEKIFIKKIMVVK